MPNDRLISADSHVAVRLEAIRERVPSALHETFDDAIAEQARIDHELKGGRNLSLADFDMDAFRDPGYYEPVARLAAMDRDGVEAEVLYSEVSAFRAFGLVKGDWRPISRAFSDHLSEFTATDPKRLIVSYQVPVIDIDYAVEEVQRLAELGGAQCTSRTSRPSSGCPTTTTRTTTGSGAPSRRPGSRSATISETGRGSMTCIAATRPPRPGSSPRCPRSLWPR